MFITIKPIPPIDIRQATDEDFDFLYAMHIATMKDYVDQIWGWDDAFQESLFRERYIPNQNQVITFEGKDIGMIFLEERTDDVLLRAIEILPTHQGQGIGTRIIQVIIDDAASKQKPVSLSVLKGNPAKSLYERLGFSVIEETDPRFFMKTS
ncbi:MAG TPA: GNAT family N-acetyltransferase [Anaerolineales bacterium]